MVHGDFRDLIGRTAFDKLLSDETFNIAKNPKYAVYQRGFDSVVYNFTNVLI